MTSKLDNRSDGDRARQRAYHRDLWPGIVGYVVVLGAVVVTGGTEGAGPWRFLWAVLPVLPALWVLRAVLRRLRRSDDYQRQLMLQGMAVGFGVAMVAALTLGILGSVGLSLGVGVAGWIVYGAGMVSWLVTSQTAERW